MNKTQHYFLSSVRQGLAAAIDDNTTVDQRARINVKLKVTARVKGTLSLEEPAPPITQNVQLYGPGDVLGFDTRIITRIAPNRDVGDFEPNYFPHIEFADPDFIWRYTAAKADQGSGNLKPWLSLIVLVAEPLGDDIQAEFTEGAHGDDKLPPYIVVNAASSLPDLTFSDRWAHVHITAGQGMDENKLLDILRNEPQRSVCRLLCTRRLQPKVKYTAFVVPSFKLGVYAGLGWSFTDGLDTWDLRLMSVSATGELVDEGRSMVVVALVGTDLHIRIFDASGEKVVDKPESELVAGAKLTALKQRLSPLPDESSLSDQDKQEIIANATSIAGYTHLDALTPAWSGGETEVKLPYYYRWDFRTGMRGDFEHLVRLLEPRKLTAMGKRDVDCANPGFGLYSEKHVLGMEGGLQTLDTRYTYWGRDLDIRVPDKGIIQDVKVYRQRADAIEIAWRTTEPASSRVEYGETDNYGQHVPDDSLKLEHRLSVTGLVEGVSYHIKIASAPQSGTTSETVDKTFNLPPQDPFQENLADLLNKPNTEDMEPRLFEFNCTDGTVITNIEGSAIPTGDKIEITWETITNSPSRIEYGRKGYDQVVEAADLKQDHKLVLPKLIPGKSYQFKIIAQDADGAITDTTEGDFTMPPLPAVLPPVYGRWHRGSLKQASGNGIKKIVDASDQREWLDALNLDPRHRIAAGLGSEVIRKHQEPLMASAWEQLGEVEKINGILRNAQLGRDTSAALHRKLEVLDPEAFFQVTAAVQRKVPRDFIADEPGRKVTTDQYLHRQSRVQGAALDPAFRRVAGPKNSVSKRQLRNRADKQRNVTAGLAKIKLEPAGKPRLVFGTPRIQSINRRLERRLVGSLAVLSDRLQPKAKVRFNDRDFRGGSLGYYFHKYKPFETADKPNSEENSRQEWVKAAVKWLQVPSLEGKAPERDDQFLDDFRKTLSIDIDPQQTIMERSRRQLHHAGKIEQRFEPDRIGDALDPVAWAPEYLQAMYEVLRDISHDLLIPGVEKIPQNTLGLLKTNRRFVEAYLCGCNHEFAGELLWRGFPTDQRGSYFRQFWDVDNYVPRPDELNALWQGWLTETRLASLHDLSPGDKQLIFMRHMDKAVALLVKTLLAKYQVGRIEELPEALQGPLIKLHMDKALDLLVKTLLEKYQVVNIEELPVNLQGPLIKLRGVGYSQHRLDALFRLPKKTVDDIVQWLVKTIDELPFAKKKELFKRNIDVATGRLVDSLPHELPSQQRKAVNTLLSREQVDDRLKALSDLPIEYINGTIKEDYADVTKLPLDDKYQLFQQNMELATTALLGKWLRAADDDVINELPNDKKEAIEALQNGDISKLLALSPELVTTAINQLVKNPAELPFEVKQQVFVRHGEGATDLLLEKLLEVAEVKTILELPDDQQQAYDELVGGDIAALSNFHIGPVDTVISAFVTDIDALPLSDKQIIFQRDLDLINTSLLARLLVLEQLTIIEKLPVEQQQTIRILRGYDRLQYRIAGLPDLLGEPLNEQDSVNIVIDVLAEDLDDIPFQEKRRLFAEDMDRAVDMLLQNLLDAEGKLPDKYRLPIRALQADRIEALSRLPIAEVNNVVKELATEQALKNRLADIKPLDLWQGGILGENRNGPVERLVLVIRGDLLKRYPNAIIYAIDAVPKNCTGGEDVPDVPGMREYLECNSEAEIEQALAGIKRIFPVFSAILPPDLTLLGFPFDREAACGCDGDAGKYFVIEEQVSEPLFGLDVSTEEPHPIEKWPDDLSWSHFGFGSQEMWDLRLMSVSSTGELVDEGRSLVVVALVGTDLHIRIFDASGEKVVDKPESELVAGAKLTALKQRLSPLPHESSLSDQDKQEIIANATSIVGYSHQECSYYYGRYLDPPPNPTLPKLNDAEKEDWNNGSSARRAWLTSQKPVRIAVHASQMIPETSDPRI